MANEGIGAPYAIISAATLTAAFTGASGTMSTRGSRQVFLDLAITFNAATSMDIEVSSSVDDGTTWDLVDQKNITAADGETKVRLPYVLGSFEDKIRVRAKDTTGGSHAVLTVTAQVGTSSGVPLVA